MMRSLFAGVAGLRTHQSRMDVIGNNIANVNTTGYKSQSMVFSDLMYQTTQAASGANAQKGGVNARQIGLGSKTGAIKTAITNQGGAQSTNDGFDMMIDGDSFFVVSDGQQNYFTRDGSFYVDGAGNLCMTSNGYTVMGWQVDAEGNIVKGTVSKLQIMNDSTRFYEPEATSQARVIGNVDKMDTDITGNGRVMDLEFYDAAGYKYTAKLNVHETSEGSGEDGDFTITLDDILNSDGKSIMWKIEADGSKTSTGVTATLGGNDSATGIQLKFDPATGKFENVGGADTFQLEVSGREAMNGHPVTVDCSTMTNVNTNGSSTCSALKGTDAGLGKGRMQGERIGCTVQDDGKIYLNYSNGMSRLIGQIAVATFANASGLEKAGNNLYSATMNSGEFDGIGHVVTEDGGLINTGVLEMSNVELAQEFTEMITTQRGFQANSRIITVSDTLLEELTNLKR